MTYHLIAIQATAKRILRQLSHDHRTIALIFIVPCLLMALLRWIYSDNLGIFNQITPALLGIFPFTIMFIITSVTTLRERTSGTLERLMAMPISKLDLILGYMIAFGLLAVGQAILVSSLVIYGFDLSIAGPEWFLIFSALLTALLGTAFGLFLSAFARTEFQAVQFMPAFVLPQLLIGGLLMPISQMPGILEIIARLLPLTYAIEALSLNVTNAVITSNAWLDVYVMLGFIFAAITLGAISLRRQTD